MLYLLEKGANANAYNNVSNSLMCGGLRTEISMRFHVQYKKIRQEYFWPVFF